MFVFKCEGIKFTSLTPKNTQLKSSYLKHALKYTEFIVFHHWIVYSHYPSNQYADSDKSAVTSQHIQYGEIEIYTRVPFLKGLLQAPFYFLGLFY